jgi:predicted O-methyltransferase YrrM
MRTIIKNSQWDKYYYYKPERWTQRKMKNEAPEKEINKVDIVLSELFCQKFIPTKEYDQVLFDQFRKKVHNNFFIYWTAINPPMERLLWALSYILKPKNILGLGVFTGNPVVWSMGPALQKVYPSSKLVGVEIDKSHAEKGQQNFDKIRGEIPVSFLGEDGFQVIPKYQNKEIDLLYLDGNGLDPTSGKKGKIINSAFAKAGYDKIRPGGWMMCHNAYQKSFLRDAKPYLDFTDDTRFFEKTVTIGIDEMGLEFSIKTQ